MYFYDLTEFLKLSAVLNYQLSAKQINWNAVLTILFVDKKLSRNNREILMQVFEYLYEVYGQRKRRLGSPSILHPLRATVLLSRSMDKANLLDFITILLHDNFEDIRSEQYTRKNEIILNHKFQSLIKNFSEEEQQILVDRLQWLTKGQTETYYRYIGRLLTKAENKPEVVRVKLADRLDNTMDMRIDLQDPLEGVDFFETVFQMLFTSTFKGYKPDIPHISVEAINGAQRLYQLFKNIVLMSLIRQKDFYKNDKITQIIFNNLAKASMREAQRIALHIFGYHETHVPMIRELMLDTMNYVQRGGIDKVTSPSLGHRLDGLFMSRFDDPIRDNLEKKLAVLYKDKKLMIEAAVAFIVIFLSFMNDANYYVHGISEKGVHP